jgi:hypothetical protein
VPLARRSLPVRRGPPRRPGLGCTAKPPESSEGHATKLAGTIRRQATTAHLTPPAANPDCLTNRPRYLDQITALANGWPLGTGIAEGVCRDPVNDRIDITGAGSGLTGAEAILKRRVVNV